MEVSIGKKYRTRNGKAVRIFCTDLRGELPVGGVICYEDSDAMERWSSSGGYNCGTKESGFDLIEVSPYADFKKDDPVMVACRNEQDNWNKRYFSHEKGGAAFVFDWGATSWSSDGRTTSWTQCRRPTPEELAG